MFKFFLLRINYKKIPLALPVTSEKHSFALRYIEDSGLEHLRVNVDNESELNLVVDKKKRYIYLDKGNNQIVSLLHFNDINYSCMNVITHFINNKSFDRLEPESISKFYAWIKD